MADEEPVGQATNHRIIATILEDVDRNAGFLPDGSALGVVTYHRGDLADLTGAGDDRIDVWVSHHAVADDSLVITWTSGVTGGSAQVGTPVQLAVTGLAMSDLILIDWGDGTESEPPTLDGSHTYSATNAGYVVLVASEDGRSGEVTLPVTAAPPTAPQLATVTPNSGAPLEQITLSGIRLDTTQSVFITGAEAGTSSASIRAVVFVSVTASAVVLVLPEEMQPFPLGRYNISTETDQGVSSNNVSFTLIADA